MSTMLEIGEPAPDFSLIGTDGMIYNLTQYRGSRAIVVMFINEGSPSVIGCEEYLRSLAESYYHKGVVFVAINPENDTPDIYDQMTDKMEKKGFPWPYLHDPTQRIVKQYGACSAPHFYLLDHNRYLIYSGRALDNPDNPDASTDDTLKAALDEYLDSRPITHPRTEPVGSDLKISITV